MDNNIIIFFFVFLGLYFVGLGIYAFVKYLKKRKSGKVGKDESRR